MVRLLSMDATGGTILFRRHLPHRMLLIDRILWSNMFPLQHIIQRRGAILEVLCRISEGFWLSPVELIMTSLFHFEDRVHRQSLPRVESVPLLFPRLLCQVLEHIGFPTDPRLECRRDYEATLTVDQWRARPRAFLLPPPGSDEDESAADRSLGDLSPIAENTEEHPTLTPSVPLLVPLAPPTTAPVAPAPVPQTPMSSIPPKPSVPMPTARSDIARPSTSAPPHQFITISTRDFLTIMEAVYSFSITAASFAASHATLADRITCTEAAVAQNQAILMQLQSHLGLPAVSPHAPAQASTTPPPAGSAPPLLAPTDPLDMLAVAAASTTPPAAPTATPPAASSPPLAAPQPVQAEDDSSSATD